MQKSKTEPQVMPEDRAKRDTRYTIELNTLIVMCLCIYFKWTWTAVYWYLALWFMSETLRAVLRRKSLYLRIAFWWYRIGALREIRKENKAKTKVNVNQYRDELKNRLNETRSNETK